MLLCIIVLLSCMASEFQKIGTRGITLLSASGDSGCHGRTDPDCQKKVFSPDFPGAPRSGQFLSDAALVSTL